MSDPKEMSKEQMEQLSTQVDDLNKKIDKLNAKLEKSETTNTTILEQQKQMLEATNNTRSQEIMRQTVSNPTGLIAKEAAGYIVRALEKNQKSKTQQWMATRGKSVVEAAVTQYISQKLPQVNWYGTTCTGTLTADNYHLITKTNFPVEINTGVPFVGKIALAKVVLEIESDVNTKTNQTSNIKCHLSSEQMNKGLWDSLSADFVSLVKPHKFWWGLLYPIGAGIQKLYAFLKRQPNFSIPLLILFILTLLVYPQIPPAIQIWNAFGARVPAFGLFGIRPINILFGLINGIIWGGIIWAVIRFKLLPGLGKLLNFIRTRVFPAIKKWFMHPYRRWGTVTAVVAIAVVVVLWRVGVFEPPPPLQVASIVVPNGRVGSAYEAAFTPAGGRSPYLWSISAASILPDGLTLDATKGKLLGTPTKAGVYPVTVQVQDSSIQKLSLTKDININLSATDSLIITTTSLPKAKLGDSYVYQIAVLGGSGPFRWGIKSGTLPPGLIMSATGAITGIPTNKGDYTFAVTLDDSSATKMVYDQPYTLTVQ